jgi:putative ATPase
MNKEQNLFEDNETDIFKKLQNTPLAALLAPKELEDFAGQEHLLSKGKMLRRLIDSDRVRSAVFFGPPGCGKTALARYISNKTKANIHELNAAVAGINDLRPILNEAKQRRDGLLKGSKTLLILDEIHHFNRTQQDVLLPSIERGEIVLIGMTVENPFFYINNALISRFSVFEFQPLNDKAREKIINRAIEKFFEGKITIDKDAKRHLITQCGGDGRKLLNAFELAVLSTKPDDKGVRHITLEIAEESIQKRSLRYDKSSDEHYDNISAFIKSMRGSDPDAALYWMAKMLSAGEDPRFIARRILILTAEDIGNADPTAIILAQTAFNAVEKIGMPEARIILAQAAVYAACAPKSNASYMGIENAMSEVKNGPFREVPMHLRDANLDSDSRGHGKGYKYPHDYPNHWTEQEYMPNPVKFYEPSEQGREKIIKDRLKTLKSNAKKPKKQ